VSPLSCLTTIELRQHQRFDRTRARTPKPASNPIIANNIQRASIGTGLKALLALTTVLALELLLFGVGSGWSLVALAVLTIVPEKFGATLNTTLEIVTVWPFARLPMLHGNPPLHGDEAETFASPAGAGSAIVTFAAVSGP
jgi:hypothetical protein